MNVSNVPTVAVAVLVVSLAAACESPESADESQATEGNVPIVQPGAPGQPSREISAAEAVSRAEAEVFTDADVRFMQGMIGHHAQAIEMSALVADRTERDVMRDVALRITLSQEDEIGMMQGWLTSRGYEAPEATSHTAHDTMLMPGMLTADEMSRLEAATGDEFDILFLEFMIKHHEGALTMVDELYATPGGGEETVIATFTGDVVADQRAEMDRMTAMINSWR